MVEIIDNFLSDIDYDVVNENSKIIFNNKRYQINKKWNNDIVEYSKPVYYYQLEKTDDVYKIVSNQIKKKYNHKIEGILFYYWSPGSYIPWHDDHTFDGGMTLYLNENWEYSNGGLFSFYQDNSVKSIIPEKNKSIVQFGSVPHSTTITSMNSEYRRTVQIFFTKSVDKKSII